MNNAARKLAIVAPVLVPSKPARKTRNFQPPVPPAPTRREALEAMTAADVSVVDQVWLATRRDNLAATIGGFLLGGFVPLATFAQAHFLKDQLTSDLRGLLVLGGLIFSCYTVVAWGRKAFGSLWKALGFVALVEGSMTFSRVEWVAYAALAFLIVINGVATGVTLALSRWRSER